MGSNGFLGEGKKDELQMFLPFFPEDPIWLKTGGKEVLQNWR